MNGDFQGGGAAGLTCSEIQQIIKLHHTNIRKRGKGQMRRLLLTATLALVLGLVLLPVEGTAQMDPGMTGEEGYGQWNYCPYCGQPLWGPGMRGPGYGRGYGMRPPGWGRGPGYGPGYGPQYGPRYQQPQEPLEKKEVTEMLENYLQSTRNPNLKLGNIEDKGSYFEAEILTKDDSLADKIAVDKNTGWMRSIY
jgi:hypothetical protein